jgi:annexin A7/11
MVYNRPAFFADRLEHAMKGLGTNDDALIRIIVDRCEIDLANIKLEYERIYLKTLISSVKVNGYLNYIFPLVLISRTGIYNTYYEF